MEEQPLRTRIVILASLFALVGVICLLVWWLVPAPAKGSPYFFLPVLVFGYGGLRDVSRKHRKTKEIVKRLEHLEPEIAAAETRLPVPKEIHDAVTEVATRPVGEARMAVDFSRFVQTELKKLVPGFISFTVSERMTVGRKEIVEARITKKDRESLEATLQGFKNVSVEAIKVGTLMKAKLRGENFSIAPQNSEEQAVPDDGFAAWKWGVTPEKSGIHILVLLIIVSIKSTGFQTNYDLPVKERRIEVAVNPAYATKQFVTKNWQWLIGSFIGSGLLLWLFDKLVFRSKP